MALDPHDPNRDLAVTYPVPERHRISWGAVFAGVSLSMALSWLLLLLGAALGASIADATDLAAVGDGLGLGSIIWILLTSVVATFAGALLAAKLVGSPDDRIGALHGLTVWSVGMLVIVLLGASGIGGAVNAISGVVGASATAGTTVINTATGGDQGDMLPDSVATSIAAILKRQVARVISDTATGSASPEQREVRSAMESLSSKDTQAITSALIAGDTRRARQELAQRTELSEEEIQSIVRGAQQQVENWTASDGVQRAENWLKRQLTDAQRAVSESVANMAGPEVSAREIRRAVDELDGETLTEAGQYLIMGEPEMAKNVLTASTNLTQSEIDAVVDGAQQEVQQLVDEARRQVNETTEAIGDYTQAALWAAFIAAALGVVAGWV
ncbi:MAG: hypothetical protein KDI01_07735, partial [Halioglobus sp.]|nr:hypothetical protein [Halioglobus sp.]